MEFSGTTALTVGRRGVGEKGQLHQVHAYTMYFSISVIFAHDLQVLLRSVYTSYMYMYILHTYQSGSEPPKAAKMIMQLCKRCMYMQTCLLNDHTCMPTADSYTTTQLMYMYMTTQLMRCL